MMMDEAVANADIANTTQDGTAIVGAVVTLQARQSTKVVAFVRRKINEICEEPYTRALAWALHLHHNEPKMTVEGLFRFLDEIGARPPKGRNMEWIEYYDQTGNQKKSEKMVSRLRKLLSNNGVEVNH